MNDPTTTTSGHGIVMGNTWIRKKVVVNEVIFRSA
jgi:hypothetical protein